MVEKAQELVYSFTKRHRRVLDICFCPIYFSVKICQTAIHELRLYLSLHSQWVL